MANFKGPSLTIDPALRSRLTVLAARAGTSLEEFAEAVLRAHADEQERLAEEPAEDEQRWQRYLAGGRIVSFEEVRSRLVKLAGDAARKAERQ